MRIYFRLFNWRALNIGAFYSDRYRRWYIQLIPAVLCMVIARRRRPTWFQHALDQDIDGDL